MADMQAGLGQNFSMLIHPGAELTLLAPSEAAFELLGFNSSVLPAANITMQLSETWVLQQAINTSSAATAKVVVPSLLGHSNVTLCGGANGTEAVVNGNSSRILQPDIPACKSWVHVIESVLGF